MSESNGELIAYALWWPENVLHGVILASQISQLDYEKFRVVPLYAIEEAARNDGLHGEDES